MLRRLLAPFVTMSLSVLVCASCDRSPSCKRLAERMKTCGTDGPAGLSEDTVVTLCEKRRDRPSTRAQIACSTRSRCPSFRACLSSARDEERRALLERRWTEVSRAVAEGRYAQAFTFCDVRKDELAGAMKKRCEALPTLAYSAMTRELTAVRDSGEVPGENARCHELKRVALRVGPKARRAADDLCEELEVARRLVATRAEVARVLDSERPFLTYGCQLLRLEELTRRVQSPYSRRVRSQLVDLCLNTLGKRILELRVPSQKSCEVRDVYQAVRKLELRDPGLDPLMDAARKHCEPMTGPGKP